ncbi:MAG: carnitine 3-dehydrogenase [Pseudomonadota bacterium]
MLEKQSEPLPKIALIGAGVIGTGWAARFLSTGFDVYLFDNAPNDNRKMVDKATQSARQSMQKIISLPLPKMGQLHICKNLKEAVQNSDYIQENIPERLNIKHQLYEEIENITSRHTIIASSTSGFTPSQLRENAKNPERIIVAHPFVPVYLIPLVELVGGAENPFILSAKKILNKTGMHALILKKEIDAHIADRLLESVWREALWLIKDDIATTSDIDQAICFGFGLRWAQMGCFETYRLGGGKAGMAHFLEQFAPTLTWPWTHLTDVPKLDHHLIEKIKTQSDQQSGHMSIESLETMRDQNVTGFLQTLKANRWGAGLAILEWEKTLRDQTFNITQNMDLMKPLPLYQTTVSPEWIDYNGHMTEYQYGHVFSDATDAFLKWIGMDQHYLQQKGSFYTVENHVFLLKEIMANTELSVETMLIGYDEKRLHLYHTLKALPQQQPCATFETMLIHVDVESRKTHPMHQDIINNLNHLWQYHKTLPKPENLNPGFKKINAGKFK